MARTMGQARVTRQGRPSLLEPKNEAVNGTLMGLLALFPSG
jgi:hypothetical protein